MSHRYTCFLSLSSSVATLVALCLLFQSSVLAADDVRSLKITVLSGEGAFNDIKRGRAQNVQVQVLDQSDRPVPGASVVFKLPASGSAGAGGTFGKSDISFSATTGADGRATTVGLRPNSVEGRFNILVQASYQGVQAQTVVSESNTTAGAQGGSGSHKALWLILLAAGGAGGAAIAARRGGGTPATPTPVPVTTTLSVGSVSVGGPQ